MSLGSRGPAGVQLLLVEPDHRRPGLGKFVGRRAPRNASDSNGKARLIEFGSVETVFDHGSAIG
jgi:hypothetical protein